MTGEPIDLLFLGSGNAFALEGRAYSSFLLNSRYLFDCGPTVMQQLRKAGVNPHDIDAVLISHFHADHFFGLPSLLLDAKYGGRDREITIVGPPGIAAATEQLLRLGYPGLVAEEPSAFARHYVEYSDGFESTIAGLPVTAASVDHVAEFEAFAVRADIGGRSLVYSGDSTLCDGLMLLAEGADVLVLECSCEAVPVHLSPEQVGTVIRQAPQANIVLTHLDGQPEADPRVQALQREAKVHIASDLARYSF